MGHYALGDRPIWDDPAFNDLFLDAFIQPKKLTYPNGRAGSIGVLSQAATLITSAMAYTPSSADWKAVFSTEHNISYLGSILQVRHF